jgi:DNA-binding winged helix-turn-helix (wHTH) protein/TolB-like protein
MMAATLAPMSSAHKNKVFRSGDLTVYPQLGQVEIQGQIIRLALVNMQVLVTLLEHAGEVVSRADFFDRVWKNQTVSDDTLTRCISELRTQLGKHSSHSSLIETLPKRGYRWIPVVSSVSAEELTADSQRERSLPGVWKKIISTVSAGLALLLLFTMGVLWLIDSSLRSELIRVTLVPVYASQPGQALIAADLDDILKDQLLATDHLRFFAPSAVRNGSQKSFPYLSREFGAQWIIEGDIRQKQDKFRVSLSLVDAKTALVVYSLTQSLDNDPAQLEQMCSAFIAEISQALRLGGKE